VVGAWLLERAGAAGDLAGAGDGGDDEVPLIPVRMDGKTGRGARNPDSSQVRLPAALAAARGVVAAQTEVGAKTNEIVCRGHRGGADVGSRPAAAAMAGVPADTFDLQTVRGGDRKERKRP
jgi:hypothetical protein